MNYECITWPVISDIPNYESKPGYEVIETATYKKAGKIKLLSGHEAWHVINYNDVKKALINKNCVRALSNEPGAPSILPTLTPKDLLLNLDPPNHSRMKSFVAKYYSASSLAWLEEKIINAVEILLCKSRRHEELDLYSEILDPLSVKINCLLLGLPEDEIPFFRELSLTIQKSDPDHVEMLTTDFTKLYQYLNEHVRGERDNYQQGLINIFTKHRRAVHPPLNDNEIIALLIGSLLGGDQNVLTVMTKIFYALLNSDILWRFVVLNKNSIPLVVNELIRLTNLGSASAFPRICTDDVYLDSALIPIGSAIYPDVYLANRDPGIYEHPLEVNPFRQGPRHLQFGYGMHHCMGQELVRLEICTAIKALTNLAPTLRLKKDLNFSDYKWEEGIILRRPTRLPVILH